MLYHSVVMVLTGLLAPSLVGEPSWMRDYDKARELAKRAGRPLAVVIGTGVDGWQKVCEEGRIGKEAKRLLADHYVCLYVDTEHIAGQRLAGAFEIREDVGLILSDRSGRNQAFRHEGELPREDLVSRLRHFADPKRVVKETEASGRYTRDYPEESESRPTVQPAPVFYPSFMGGGGRGC